MTTINATIISDAEAWIKENIRDLSTDGVSAMNLDEVSSDFSISLYDEEENFVKTFTLEQQVAALQKLADDIGNNRLYVGIAAQDLADPCYWDVEVVDAFFQLIYHGEVIYG